MIPEAMEYIETNFDKTVTVQRLMDESPVGEAYLDFIVDLPCHIQPLDESWSQDIEGNFGKDWLMFCDSEDILEGDRVIEGTNEYRVVGVEKFKFLGRDRHMEVRLRKSNP